MPIIQDAFANGIQTSTVSCVVTLTVAAGSFLLVSAHRNAANISVSSIIANGNALTRLGFAGTTGNAGVEIWALTAPPTGVLSISANFSALGTWQITCSSYLGVQASNGASGVASATASAVTVVTSISTSANDMVCFFATGAADFSASNLTTDLKTAPHYGVFAAHTAGANNVVSVSLIVAGAVSFNIAVAGLNLRFSASANSAPYVRMMTKVGC